MPSSLGIGGSFALVRPRNAPNTLVFARHDLVDCYLSNTMESRPTNDDIIQAFVNDSRGYECDIIACMVWYARGHLYIKHLTLTMLSNLIMNRVYPVEFEVNAPADNEDCSWILQQFISLDPKNHCSTLACTWMYESNCVIKKYTNVSEYSSYDNIFDGVISIEKAGSSQSVKEDKVGGVTCNVLSEQVNEIYQLIADHWNVEGMTPELQLKCYFSFDKFGSLFFKWCHVDTLGALKRHVSSGDPSSLPAYKYMPPKVPPKASNNLLTKATFSVIGSSMIELKDEMQYMYGVKSIMIGTNNTKKSQKYIQVTHDSSVVNFSELLHQVWTYIKRIGAPVHADAIVTIHYQGDEQRQLAQQFYDEISAYLVQLPAVKLKIERLSVLINFNNDDLQSEVSDIISYDQDIAVNVINDKLLSNIEGWQSAWLSSEAVNTASSVNSDFNPKPPGATASNKGGRKEIRKQKTASLYKQSLENPFGLKEDLYVLTDREKFLLHEGDTQYLPQGGRVKENTVVDLEKIGALSKPRVVPLTAFIDDRLSNYNIGSSSGRVNTAKSSKRPSSTNSSKPSIPSHKRYCKKTMPGTTSTFKIHRSRPKTFIQLLFGGQIENAPKVRGKFKPYKKTQRLLLPEWVEPELHPKGILSYNDDDDLSVAMTSRKSMNRPSSAYSRGREVVKPELQPSRPTSSRSTNQSIISSSRAVKTQNDSEISDNLEDSSNISRSKVAVVKRAKTPPIQQPKLRIGQAMARKLEVDHSQYHADVELHDRLITNTPKPIPRPNGLAGDIMVIINRMTVSVTRAMMTNIKHARKVAIDHHNTLLTELSGNVGLSHERTLSAEKMRDIIELVTSGYHYDKNMKFSSKKAQKNYNKVTELYLEMSSSERHLVSLLQLLSCIPNHRPVDSMMTVVLWLLSTGTIIESDVTDSNASGIANSLDQPIEENYSKILKNVSRFMRGCQGQIKVINEVENQRSVDKDKASIRRKDKCLEELKAWYLYKDVGKDYEHIISRYSKLHQDSVVTAGGTRTEQSMVMDQVSISASISSPVSKSYSSAGVNGIQLMKKCDATTSATDELGGSDDDDGSIGMIPTSGTNAKSKDKLKTHLGMDAFIRSFNAFKQAVRVRKEQELESSLQPISSKMKGKVYVMSLCEVASTSGNCTKLMSKPCNVSMPVAGTSNEVQDDDSLLGFNPFQEESPEINEEYVQEIDDDFPLEDADEDDMDLQLLENSLNNAVKGLNKESETVNSNMKDAIFELDNELLFHKLAPNITTTQRNMLLLSVVSDTNRTVLLCISVLLKYLQAGKDITYDDMVNLLCTPVARAIGKKNLEDLLTWLRVNRKVGISFHPTASLSWTEMALQKITSFWPVLNVAVFEQDKERDDDNQISVPPVSECSVRLEWLEKQKIIKIFSSPNTFQPNLNNI